MLLLWLRSSYKSTSHMQEHGYTDSFNKGMIDSACSYNMMILSFAPDLAEFPKAQETEITLVTSDSTHRFRKASPMDDGKEKGMNYLPLTLKNVLIVAIEVQRYFPELSAFHKRRCFRACLWLWFTLRRTHALWQFTNFPATEWKRRIDHETDNILIFVNRLSDSGASKRLNSANTRLSLELSNTAIALLDKLRHSRDLESNLEVLGSGEARLEGLPNLLLGVEDGLGLAFVAIEVDAVASDGTFRDVDEFDGAAVVVLLALLDAW
ncbi:hypothetical protein KCU99_g267, partial [Aureobasidium melanogenum]